MKSASGGCEEPGMHSGTGLVFAGQLWHRVVINREQPQDVCRTLGISLRQTRSIIRLLRHCKGVPSRERLAVIAMMPPDVTDAEVDEWFGMESGWAAGVRARAKAIRAREPIPDRLEHIDDEYDYGIPPLEERLEAAEYLRAHPFTHRAAPKVDRVEIKSFSWNGSSHAFFPVSS
jgi:hypothetical protein